MDPKHAELIEIEKTSPEELRVALRRDLNLSTSRVFEEALRQALPETAQVVRVSLHMITMIDSSGLGTLVRIYHFLKARGGKLILVDPSPSIRNILRIVKIDTFLEIEAGSGAAKTAPAVAAEKAGGPLIPDGLPGVQQGATRESLFRRLKMMEVVADLTTPGGEQVAQILLKKDLNVANAPLYREVFGLYHKLGVQRLMLDFSQVEFIDSSGISALAEAIRNFDRIGGEVVLVNPQVSIVKILRVMKLYDLVKVMGRDDEFLKR